MYNDPIKMMNPAPFPDIRLGAQRNTNRYLHTTLNEKPQKLRRNTMLIAPMKDGIDKQRLKALQVQTADLCTPTGVFLLEACNFRSHCGPASHLILHDCVTIRLGGYLSGLKKAAFL